MDKQEKINAILHAMQTSYEEWGEEGDFDDARRYYQQDATLAEIDDDYRKWCTK